MRKTLFIFASTVFIAGQDSHKTANDEVFSMLQNARKAYHPDSEKYRNLSDIEILDSILEEVKADTAWYFEIAYNYQ